MLKPIKEAGEAERFKRGMLVIEGICLLSSESDFVGDEIDTPSETDPFVFIWQLSRNKIKRDLDDKTKLSNAIYRISHAINPHSCEHCHADWINEIEEWEKALKEMNMMDVEQIMNERYEKTA